MTCETPVQGRPPGRPAALVWALLVFAALQFALVVSLGRWQPDFFDREYGAKLSRLRARLAEHPGDPLILVLGSSRPLVGLRPAALPPLCEPDGRRPLVFNAALTGSGPVLQWMCLRRLLDEQVRPSWVLVEYWPPPWQEIDGRAEDGQIEVDRLSWRDLRLLRHYTEEPARFYAGWLGERLLPAFCWRARLLERCDRGWGVAPFKTIPTYDLADGDGWCAWPHPPTTPAEREARLARHRAIFRPILQDFRPAASCDRALRDLLTRCRREGIRAALVCYPESTTFRDCYAARTRGQVDGYLDAVGRAYGVPVIDTRDWLPDEDFADAVHLLARGADRFSVRFGREVLGPLLAGRRPAASRNP